MTAIIIFLRYLHAISGVPARIRFEEFFPARNFFGRPFHTEKQKPKSLNTQCLFAAIAAGPKFFAGAHHKLLITSFNQILKLETIYFVKKNFLLFNHALCSYTLSLSRFEIIHFRVLPICTFPKLIQKKLDPKPNIRKEVYRDLQRRIIITVR